MERNLVRLIRGLRRDGVPISTGEELDAFQTLMLVDITDRNLLRLALRGALVKNRAFYPLFEGRFSAHFTLKVKRLRKKATGKGAAAGEGEAASPAGALGLGRSPGPSPTDSKGSPRPDPRPSAARAAERPEADSPREVRRRPGSEELDGQPMPGQVGKPENPEDFRKRVEDVLGMELEEGRSESPGKEHRRNLLRVRLTGPLTLEDERRIDEEINRLARALLARKSRRERQSKSGRVDLKRVIRKNLSTDAIPFFLPRKKRRLEQSELMVLGDVSWSVQNVLRFLLRLLYAIQQKFSHIRSFAFVNRPVEITPLATRTDFPSCLAGIPELDSHIMSDYGNTFLRFLEDFGRTLSRKTILLVLGDARNNRLDPLVWALEELAGRAKEVIWLNPEEKERWDQDDSVMSAYAWSCKAVLECGNLEQLSRAVRLIAR